MAGGTTPDAFVPSAYLNGFIAVSYTHLDVYKRQASDRTDRNRYHDTLSDHCKSRTTEYRDWICTSNDRESV